MTDNLIAPAEADERSVEAVEERHAALARALHVLTQALVAAAGAGDPSLARQAQHRLVEWCEWELLPHIGAEEQAIYPAARYTAEGRFLAKALLGEHEDILALARSIVATAEPAHAAGAALALRTLLDLHLASEDQLLLPLLRAIPGSRLPRPEVTSRAIRAPDGRVPADPDLRRSPGGRTRSETPTTTTWSAG